MKRTLKKVLSFLLVMAMLAGFVPEIGVSLRANAADPVVYFYVPEAVYLKQGSQGTQWYLNSYRSASATTLVAKETTGKLFFNCAGATSVKITTSGGTVSNLTTTGTATIDDTDFQITGSAGAVVTYTATYVYGGKTYTVTSYTYLYAPNRVPSGCASETESNKHSKKYDYHGFITVLWGSQRYDTKANSGGANSACAAAEVIYLGNKGLHTAGNTRPHNTDMLNAGTGTFAYHNNDNVNVNAESPLAYFYVDTSRFTNMNQIPNMYVGLTQTDDQHTDYTEQYSWLVSGHSSGQSEPSGSKLVEVIPYTKVSTETLIRQEGACTIPYGISGLGAGSNTNYTVYTYGRSYCGGTVTHSYQHTRFQIHNNYKANLRNLYLTHLKDSIKHQAGNYTSASWTTFSNAMKNAATVLGNPYVAYSTVTSAVTTLTNAVNGLQTNLYLKASTNGGASDQTPALTIKDASTVAVNLGSYTASKSGWNFLGWNTSSTATTGSKTTANVGFNNTYYAIYSKVLKGTFHYLTAAGARTNSAPTVTIYNTATSGAVAPPALVSAKYGDVTYSALGWRTDDTAAAQTVAATGNKTISADTVYRAVYSGTLTLSYDLAGGSGSFGNQTATQYLNAGSSSVAASAASVNINTGTPTKTGYTFSSWTAAGGSLANGKFTFTNGKNGKLTANYTEHKYNIAFNGNGSTGGSTAGISNVLYSASQALTANGFTRTGYSFNGWNTKADGSGTSYADQASVSKLSAANGATVTLYAQWKINQYALTVNPNGGSFNNTTANSSFTQNYNTTKTVDDATRAGYTFTGWTLSGSGSWNASNKTFTYGAGAGTLTAGWTATPYTITYNADGGTVSPASLSYNIESNATLASAEKTGYTFTGWKPQAAAGNWNAATTYAGGASVKGMYGNVTLVAQWKINQYTLTVDPNGGTFNGSSAASAFTQDYATAKTVADPVRTGYTFTGWTLSGAGAWDAAGKTFTYGAGAATLTANWKANVYTVKFDGNGADGGATAAIEKTYGAEKALTENGFTKTGYEFKGWATAADGEKVYDDKAVLTADLATENGAEVILYAVWEAIPYEITIDLNSTDPLANYDGETGGIYQQTIALADPTRPGYTFTGWTLVSGNGALNGSEYTFGAGNAEIKANWSPINYTLTLVLNGGGISVDAETVGIIYDTVEIPDPAREGYRFTGWTKTGGGTLENGVFTFAADNCQLEAGWEAIPYSLTVDANGGEGDYGAINAAVYHIENTVEIPEPTRTGYDFAGWTIESDKAGAFADGVYTFSSADASFTANWTAHTYTIAFSANSDKDITGEMADAAAVYDTAQELPSVGFEKFGYDFVGWALAEDGEKVYDDGAQVVNLSSEQGAVVTLYAVWNAKPHTLSLEPYATIDLGVAPEMYYDGGLAPVTIDGIVYKTVTLAEPTWTGYTFTGWAVKDGTETAGALTKGSGNVWTFTFSDDDAQLVAVFVPAPVVISVDAQGDTPAAHADDVTYTGEAGYTGFYKQTVTVPSPVRRGYAFKGWDMTDAPYAPAGAVSGSFDGETFTYGSWSQNLTAAWEAIPYTVRIDLNNDEANYPTDKYAPAVFAGETEFEGLHIYDTIDLTALGEPARTGFTFLGWQAENGAIADGVYTVADSDDTIKALWEANEYTLTIDAAGGEYDGAPTVSGIIHDEVALGAIERRGYTFTGWTVENGSLNEETGVYTFADSDGRLTANWEINTYTLTVDPNEGTYQGGSSAQFTGTIGETAEIADPERFGYTFTGWTLTADEGETADAGSVADGVYTFDCENATLTAGWAINHYTVSFVYRTDAKTFKTDEFDTEYLGTVEAPAVTEYLPLDKDLSYHFIGWQNADGSAYDPTAGVIADMTVTAQYEEVGHVFTEWFDKGDLKSHYRVCVDCGYVETVSHAWDDGVVSIAPTCYTTGVMVYTCTVCGAQGAKPIDALGHDWSEWTPVPGDEPDCEHGGSEQRYCKRCGEEETREVIRLCHNITNAVLGEGYCKDCGKFICKACDQYGVLEKLPGPMGTLYKIVHFFIHTFRQIRYHT